MSKTLRQKSLIKKSLRKINLFKKNVKYYSRKNKISKIRKMSGGAGARIFSMFSRGSNKAVEKKTTELSIIDGIMKINGTEIKMSANQDIIQTILTQLLESRNTLTSFTLSNTNISQQGIIFIIDALFKNTKLTELTISKLPNTFDEPSIQAINGLLKFSDTLTSLDISNNDFGHYGTTYILDVLKDNTTITSLNISNCKNANNQANLVALRDLLKENTTLTSLDMSNNNLDNSSITHHLSGAIKSNTTLTSLNMSHNRFGYEAALFLAEELQDNNTLISLNIRNNSFNTRKDNNIQKESLLKPVERGKNDGLTRILTSIGTSQTLTELDISGNINNNDDIETVILNIFNNRILSRLQKFDIRSMNLSLHSSKLCACLRYNRTLIALMIGRNSHIEWIPYCFIDAMRVNTTLKLLDISRDYNNPPYSPTSRAYDEHITKLSHNNEIIADIIRVNDSLTHFYFNNHVIKDNNPLIFHRTYGDAYIVEALEDNYTIIDMNTSNKKFNALLNRNKKLKEKRNEPIRKKKEENDRKKKEENDIKKKEQKEHDLKFKLLKKQIKDSDPSITSLDITNSNDLKELIEALKVNTTLETININIDTINNETFKSLVEILKLNTTLSKLTLTITNIKNVQIRTFEKLYIALKSNTIKKDIVFSENIKYELDKNEPYSKDIILARDRDNTYTVNDLVVALSKKSTSQLQREPKVPVCMAVHAYFRALNDIRLAIKIMQLSINWDQNYRELRLSQETTRLKFTLYLDELLKNSELISRLETDIKRRDYVIKHIWTTLDSLINAQTYWFGFQNIPNIYSLLILIINFMKTLPKKIQIRWCDVSVSNYIGYNSNSNSDIINSNQSLDGARSCAMGSLEKFIVGIQLALNFYMNIKIISNNDNDSDSKNENENDNDTKKRKIIMKIDTEFGTNFADSDYNSKLSYSNTNKSENKPKYKDFVSDRTRLFKLYLKNKKEFKNLKDDDLDKFIAEIPNFDYKEPAPVPAPVPMPVPMPLPEEEEVHLPEEEVPVPALEEDLNLQNI